MDFPEMIAPIYANFLNGNRKDARDAIFAHGPEFAAAAAASLLSSFKLHEDTRTANDFASMLINAYEGTI